MPRKPNLNPPPKINYLVNFPLDVAEQLSKLADKRQSPKSQVIFSAIRKLYTEELGYKL